jgi:hypothetical protein
LLASQTFHYLGVTKRLKALLENKIISQYLFLSPPREELSVGTDRVVKSVYDSDGWHDRITLGKGRGAPDPTFSTENNGRNIVLSLNVDGFQPWKRVQRSLTPLVCMILNLPENLRHKSEYLILAGLIPGPKEPKQYNPYMQFLVKELQQLSDVGFDIADPYPNGPSKPAVEPNAAPTIRVRVKLLFICADLPAFGHLLCQQTQGAHHGCIKCHIVVSCELLRFVTIRYESVLIIVSY